MRDALKTLLYPFEIELLAMLGRGTRALFTGKEIGSGLTCWL